MRRFVILCCAMLFFSSCKVEPKEIDFGYDVCHFCKMTIVDKPFAAEVVNSKGKAFMYDAIECMVNNNLNEHIDASLFLVFDYTNYNEFINAKESYFVISETIKSPMGENLAAFKEKFSAEKFINVNKGKMFNWEELNAYFKKYAK
ncbi:MAG: nitrous oxide reductase accessory protein NosL [Bacteroidetes bacterium]|nr:nitrous oxide reductase accessory protein NosL [Bacteroidota bacterium]